MAELWQALNRSDKKRFAPRFDHAQVYDKSRAVAHLLKMLAAM